MGLRLSHLPDLQAWLHNLAHVNDGGEALLGGLASELRARGLPLWRANACLMTKHPEVFWRTLQWHEGETIRVLDRQHDLLRSPYYTKSPVAALRSGTSTIRVKLDPGPLPFPVCEDLRAKGGTDYVAQGLVFSNGEISYASWATRARATARHPVRSC
jgi:hypothetical protein